MAKVHIRDTSARFPLEYSLEEALRIYAHRCIVFFGVLAISSLYFLTVVLIVAAVAIPSTPAAVRPLTVVVAGVSLGITTIGLYLRSASNRKRFEEETKQRQTEEAIRQRQAM